MRWMLWPFEAYMWWIVQLSQQRSCDCGFRSTRGFCAAEPKEFRAARILSVLYSRLGGLAGYTTSSDNNIQL